MKQVIIFGAGQKGFGVLKKLNRNAVAYFADNNKEKQGKTVYGIPVISFEELKGVYACGEYDIILSSDIDEIKAQLESSNISYWNNESKENSYFEQDDVKKELDNRLLWRYLNDKELYNSAYLTETANWYRKEYISKENREVIHLLQENRMAEFEELAEKLVPSNRIYEDEYYENRPAMRLIRNILALEKNKDQKRVLDMACGHGELLLRLREDGFNVCGADLSTDKIQYLQDKGINGIIENVETISEVKRKFDIVICQECLEHVKDPNVVVKEIKAITEAGGKVFVTVPYKRYCDSDLHVRQFDENKLTSLFKINGFHIINTLCVPYLNSSRENNLFLAAGLESE